MRVQSDVAADITIRKGVTLEFAETLEAAIDCHVCRRSRRTVMLQKEERASTCTPTRHAFPGIIEEIVVSDRRFPRLGRRG